MRIIFTNIIFLLFSVTLFSQIPSVTRYYEFIFEAEQYLVEGKYRESNLSYSNAFNHKDTPFKTDIINACLVSYYAGDTLKTLYKRLTQLAVTDGGYYSFRYKNDSLREYLENNFCRELVKSIDLEKLLRLIKKEPISYNPLLCATIDSLYKTDQEVRHVCMKKYGAKYYSSPCKSNVILTDSLNNKVIINILKTEKVQEGVITNEHYQMLSTMLSHQDSWGFDSVYLILEQKVFDGTFNARNFCYIIDKKDTSKYFPNYNMGIFDSGIYGDYYVINLNKGEEDVKATIKKNRENWFLDDYVSEHRRKIWFYQHQDKGYRWAYKYDVFSFNNTMVNKILNKSPDTYREYLEIVKIK